MSGDSVEQDGVGKNGALLRVDDLPIGELLRSEDSALDRLVRQLTRDTDKNEAHYAAFGNAP